MVNLIINLMSKSYREYEKQEHHPMWKLENVLKTKLNITAWLILL